MATPSERALIEVSSRLPSDAIRTELEARTAYAKDESEAEPVLPDAVLCVRSHDEVIEVMRAAHRHGVPVTPRAGGTGRVGGAVPTAGGWVLALERFDRVHAIEEEDAIAVVEPGVVTGRLHEAVEALGLFYPPDPNSLASCTLGGNIGTNAGGPRTFRYGVTGDYVLGLDAVLADGTAIRVGRPTRKGVTGYDLTSLLVGSEGTLGIVTRATLRLLPKPEAVRTLVAFFDDEAAVSPAITACLRARIVPRCLELLDAETLSVLREDGGTPVPARARALLLVEIDGDAHELDAQLERLGGALDGAGALELLVARDGTDRERLWAVRREMSRALRRRAAHKLSEDVVVPRSRLGELLARCRAIAETHRVRMPAYGHAGDGNLHVNFLWDMPDERPRVDAAIEALFRATLELGGTLSGEHGIGVLKAPFLPLEQSAALIDLQRRIKAQFDPRGILNPGKIFPASTGHGAC